MHDSARLYNKAFSPFKFCSILLRVDISGSGSCTTSNVYALFIIAISISFVSATPLTPLWSGKGSVGGICSAVMLESLASKREGKEENLEDGKEYASFFLLIYLFVCLFVCLFFLPRNKIFVECYHVLRYICIRPRYWWGGRGRGVMSDDCK